MDGNFKLLERNKVSVMTPPLRKISHAATTEVRSVVKRLAESTNYLPQHSGYAIMSFGAQSDYGQTWLNPFNLVPEALKGFCEQVLHRTPLRLAQEMETYMLKDGAPDYLVKEEKCKDIRSCVRDGLQLSFGEFSLVL
jgi:hypothetical protein